MLEKLSKSAPEHIRSLADEIPSMTRIRPCEVVVAVTGVPDAAPPYEFGQIEPHSVELASCLCE